MTEKLAIDANLLVRNATRRLMMGVAEVARFQVVIPATAAEVAKQVYRKVRAQGEKRRVEHDVDLRGAPENGKEASDQLTQALDNVETGFAQWLDNEPLRNDAMIDIAASSERTREVASALLLAEVVDDPDVRIPGQADHRFRSKPITHSDSSRSPIPDEPDHRFRSQADHFSAMTGIVPGVRSDGARGAG